MTCRGTPLSCTDRAQPRCAGGCHWNDTSRCVGGKLSCSLFTDFIDECPPECDEECAGEVECSAFGSNNCPSVVDYDGDLCKREDLGCHGTPIPCEEVPLDQCDPSPAVA